MAGETPGAGTPSAGGQRGIREGTLMWPMLTRTNYSEWAMLMQCNFEALEVWEAIVPGKNVSRSTDRQAMSALMHSVPSDMWAALGAKSSVKEAWDLIKTLRQGTNRVKEVNAQKLTKEFENLAFKEGESVEDFGLRVTTLIANLKDLGEVVESMQ